MVHDADTSANAHQPRFAATADMGQNLWHPPAGPDEKCTQAQVWCTVQRLLSREYAPVSVDTNLESEEDAISISEWSECCLDLLHAIVKVGQLLDYDIQIKDVKTKLKATLCWDATLPTFEKSFLGFQGQWSSFIDVNCCKHIFAGNKGRNLAVSLITGQLFPPAFKEQVCHIVDVHCTTLKIHELWELILNQEPAYTSCNGRGELV
jgi:hypothetical protein